MFSVQTITSVTFNSEVSVRLVIFNRFDTSAAHAAVSAKACTLWGRIGFHEDIPDQSNNAGILPLQPVYGRVYTVVGVWACVHSSGRVGVSTTSGSSGRRVGVCSMVVKMVAFLNRSGEGARVDV